MSSLCYSHILVSFRIVTSMGANSGPIIWSRITFLQKKKEIKKKNEEGAGLVERLLT